MSGEKDAYLRPDQSFKSLGSSKYPNVDRLNGTR